MKAAIIGVGQMGRSTAWAMHKLGFDELVIADVDADNLNECEALIDMKSSVWKRFINGSSSIEKYVVNKKYPDYSFIDKDVDVVISALPYHQNTQLAYHCVCKNVAYCDLGGNEGISGGINEMGRRYMRCSIMTDLGLAPGWVNIMAENMCQEYMEREGEAPHTVTMIVGGLPKYPNNTLKYSCTWSYDGLINEYRDDCEILKDGKIARVRGMEGYEKIYVDWVGKKFEAFYTSGGVSHTIRDMQSRGVKNCSYKTIRFVGHRDVVRFLIRDCGLSDENLAQIFQVGCANKTDSKDMVILKAEVEKGPLKWGKEIFVPADENFTAMQRATAFPISAVASLMAKGALEGDRDEHRDYHTQYPKVLSYKDVPIKEFNKKIEILGLNDA